MRNKMFLIVFFIVFITASSASTVYASTGFSQHSSFHQTKKEAAVSVETDEIDNRHPSGKDRSVEPGNSFPQGHAQSDVDDNGRGPNRANGGQDQPGGLGGIDKEDQDGNNGCGNDDDFEDDNEGWCGKLLYGGGVIDEGNTEGSGSEYNDSNNVNYGDDDSHSENINHPSGKSKVEVVVAGYTKEGGRVLSLTNLPVTGLESKGIPLGLGLVLVLVGTGLYIFSRKDKVLASMG